MDKIVQVSGFSVDPKQNGGADYLLVGVTEGGEVVMSTGDRKWAAVGPYPSPKPSDGWIEAENRFPSRQRDVLVYTPIDGWVGKAFYGPDGWSCSEIVSHWRDMPNPPEKNNE